ncbi:host attachment protein [Thiohalocapsa marina]|uniref:Host attachment protein n=1 Tax=Thiohalocapsa marina TaxID=424902 RepID=A0A5M8FJK4_9GAMM|nr:host attachment protein [Thiohalocapsa marina]KAA6185093.1 host attachment protein [Thiohalocapsa marina]
MTIWVLAADNSRARFFTAEKARSPLTEIRDLVDPQARLHEGDLVTDRDGRDRRAGSPIHGVGSDNSAKDDAADRFAQQVCAELETARVEGAFSKLYVVAAPAFLGLLRKHQSAPLRALVAGETDKNMTTQNTEAIRAQLPDFL